MRSPLISFAGDPARPEQGLNQQCAGGPCDRRIARSQNLLSVFVPPGLPVCSGGAQLGKEAPFDAKHAAALHRALEVVFQVWTHPVCGQGRTTPPVLIAGIGRFFYTYSIFARQDIDVFLDILEMPSILTCCWCAFFYFFSKSHPSSTILLSKIFVFFYLTILKESDQGHVTPYQFTIKDLPIVLNERASFSLFDAVFFSLTCALTFSDFNVLQTCLFLFLFSESQPAGTNILAKEIFGKKLTRVLQQLFSFPLKSRWLCLGCPTAFWKSKS